MIAWLCKSSGLPFLLFLICLSPFQVTAQDPVEAALPPVNLVTVNEACPVFTFSQKGGERVLEVDNLPGGNRIIIEFGALASIRLTGHEKDSMVTQNDDHESIYQVVRSVGVVNSGGESTVEPVDRIEVLLAREIELEQNPDRELRFYLVIRGEEVHTVSHGYLASSASNPWLHCIAFDTEISPGGLRTGGRGTVHNELALGSMNELAASHNSNVLQVLSLNSSLTEANERVAELEALAAEQENQISTCNSEADKLRGDFTNLSNSEALTAEELGRAKRVLERYAEENMNLKNSVSNYQEALKRAVRTMVNAGRNIFRAPQNAARRIARFIQRLKNGFQPSQKKTKKNN